MKSFYIIRDKAHQNLEQTQSQIILSLFYYEKVRILPAKFQPEPVAEVNRPIITEGVTPSSDHAYSTLATNDGPTTRDVSVTKRKSKSSHKKPPAVQRTSARNVSFQVFK